MSRERYFRGEKEGGAILCGPPLVLKKLISAVRFRVRRQKYITPSRVLLPKYGRGGVLSYVSCHLTVVNGTVDSHQLSGGVSERGEVELVQERRPVLAVVEEADAHIGLLPQPVADDIHVLRGRHLPLKTPYHPYRGAAVRAKIHGVFSISCVALVHSGCRTDHSPLFDG